MRGTLHLLAPDEAGAYLSLVGASRPWEKPSWQKAFGVTPDEMLALGEAVGQVLDGQVLRRNELVAAVAEVLRRADLKAHLRSGWGTVLKPVAWKGGLCHATPDGNRVTFARPDQWLRDWGGVPDPDEAALSASIAACHWRWHSASSRSLVKRRSSASAARLSRFAHQRGRRPSSVQRLPSPQRLARDVLADDWISEDDPAGRDVEFADFGLVGARA